jgi:hypothetical protein
MTFLKKIATIAIVASTGVIGSAGIASAHDREGGDNAVSQGGLIPINALNNVNVSPNLGCILPNDLNDLNVLDGVGLIGVAVPLNHLLEHTALNILANGNITTETDDHSCTSNQGSSQSGNNSRGSIGAGSSYTSHESGEGAGSKNEGAGAGAGGLLGATGILGRGGLNL